MRAKAKRGWGRVLLAALSLVASLGAAELAYRAIAADRPPNGGDEHWYRRYRAMNTTLYQRSADRELIYEPVAGSSIEMEYGLAAFNGQRLREDHEVAALPDAQRTRVAIVGDSLVWSEYLSQRDAIPSRVGEALGPSFEALNAGVTGYDTTQEARWYEVAVRPLHPRVVVLVFCMNDLLIMSGPYGRFADGDELAIKDAQDAMFARVAPVRRETIDELNDRSEREASWRLLARLRGVWDRWRLESSYVDEYLIVADDPARRARLMAALDRMGSAIRSDGAIPVLVISPVLERWDDYRWRGLHRIVADAGERARFAVRDPLDELRADHDADELRSGSDNLHYGRTGSRIFGARIADAVREALR